MILAKDPFTKKQDDAFLEWIRTLPSILTGRVPCVPAHVLSVAHGAGKGRKPRLFCVPLTAPEHNLQHQQGYLTTLFYFKRDEIIGQISDPKAGLNWFKERAQEHRDRFLAEVWVNLNNKRGELWLW